MLAGQLSAVCTFFAKSSSECPMSWGSLSIDSYSPLHQVGDYWCFAILDLPKSGQLNRDTKFFFIRLNQSMVLPCENDLRLSFVVAKSNLMKVSPWLWQCPKNSFIFVRWYKTVLKKEESNNTKRKVKRKYFPQCLFAEMSLKCGMKMHYKCMIGLRSSL